MPEGMKANLGVGLHIFKFSFHVFAKLAYIHNTGTLIVSRALR